MYIICIYINLVNRHNINLNYITGIFSGIKKLQGRARQKWMESAQKENGEGGIRTPGRAFQPYSGLANRRTKPTMRPLRESISTSFYNIFSKTATSRLSRLSMSM